MMMMRMMKGREGEGMKLWRGIFDKVGERRLDLLLVTGVNLGHQIIKLV